MGIIHAPKYQVAKDVLSMMDAQKLSVGDEQIPIISNVKVKNKIESNEK